MTDFELIEQAIAEQERELQKLESEIQQKRQMLDRQRQALSVLQPLLNSVLGEPPKVLTVELEPVLRKTLGSLFKSGNKIRDYHEP
jgi:uncharacterized coiled-coil protein SlyX